MNRRMGIFAVLIFAILIIPMAAWAFGTISGTVTDQTTSLPVSGVSVRLANNSSGTLIKSTTTDANGLYTLASITAGPAFQVQTRSGQYYEHQNVFNVTVTDGNTTTINFSLPPGGEIRGTVTDNATGLPISGVQIMIFDSTWFQYRTLITSVTGTYTAGGLPVRSDYRVAVVGNSTYAGQWQSPISVTPGVPVTVNYSLFHSGTIAGTVTDSVSSLPVAGIDVNAYIDGWPISPGVVTNINGQYTLVGMPEYSGITVQSTATASYLGYGQGGVSVTIGNTTMVNFSLQSTTPGLVIPTATITVDGDAADWTGISPLVNDPQNDAVAYFSAYSGSDIKAIYAAKDDTNLYVRVDLWGNANTDFGNWPNAPYEGDYRLWIESNSLSYPTLYLSWAYHTGDQWSIYSNDLGVGGQSIPSLAGTGNIGVNGSVMELKVPLSDLGNPSYFYTLLANVNNCCITNPALTIDESAVTALATIAGTVTANGTGLPIPGLQVFVSGGSFMSTTDSNGHYFFAGLPEGNDFSVTVQGNGTYATQQQNGISTSFGSTTTVNFTLSQPGSISGTVTATVGGAPIANLNVWVCDSNWQCSYGGTMTDGGGNYTISGLPVRTDYQVQVQGNVTYAGQTQIGIAVTSGSTTTVNFSLSQAGSISGTVTASGTGTPLSNLQINVCISNQGCPGWAQTDGGGNYTVTDLAPRSDYQVQVQGNAMYAGQTQMGITVMSGNTTTVNFVLSQGGSISGTVTANGTGVPLANLQINVCINNQGCPGWAQTDISGYYTVTGLAPGSDYQVQVQGNATYAGKTQSGVAVTAGNATTVNFSLGLGGSITGTVRDAVTHVGIGNIGVSANDNSSRNNWIWLGGTQTNPDGTYRIDGIPSGKWLLNTYTQGGWYLQQVYNGVLNDQLATLVTVTAGMTTTGIDFNLAKGGTISGTVRNSTGGAIAGANVIAMDAAGWWISGTDTDGAGAYTLGPVPSGMFIMASAPGTRYVSQFYGGGIYLSSAATITVTAETNTPGKDFSLPEGTLLTGIVTLDGAAPQDGSLSLFSVTDNVWLMNSALQSTNIDPASGAWSVAVPAGTYKLWAEVRKNGISVPQMYYDATYLFDDAFPIVSSGTGTVSNLNFAMSSQSGTVTGTISYSGNKSGQVIEWISPNAGNDWPKMSSGNGGGVGAYALASPAGTWHVKAFMDVNGNMSYDAGEPFGEYAGGAVVVINGETLTGINIALAGKTPAPAKIGVFQNGTWYLDANQSWDWNGTPTDILGIFGVGLTGAIPVVGDWNGDGKTEIGVYIDGIWYLDMNSNWQWDGEPTDVRGVFGVGLPNAIPVVGDWNGDGVTEIGIYSSGNWYLDKNRNWQWDGTPTDTYGVFGVGLPNVIPVTGDWTGDGTTKIGVYSEGNWYLDKNANWQWDGTPTDTYGLFGVGLPNVQPVTGDWNGNGITKIGVYSDGYWYLDTNASWQWDGTPTDTFGIFGVGLGTVVPVTGNW